MSSKLGIVAGGGSLPQRLIEACRRDGREVFVVAVKGQADASALVGTPHEWVRIGAPGRAVELAREHGITEVVFAGRFRRPSLLEVFPDWLAMQFILEVGKHVFRDDGFHKAVVDWAGRLGFRILGPETIDRGLLAPEGVLGAVEPDAEAWNDIARGIEVARALGSADVGQGSIVQQGVVLAVEAIEGTDAMIARAGKLRLKGRGGVLVKARKPAQEARIDLPVIGVRTIKHAKAAGLSGIAIEAGGALVIDREEVVEAADAARIFVVGVKVSA
ncbi:MAG TPA: UDP-2,3-diacylglucosamine diphosphatase LpxI [Alphaproteobacteria bacterium]|nr:UDP-2,3-diacylglucosamine diphosphatase LpxI [Alphaproteobacteria bacterium]